MCAADFPAHQNFVTDTTGTLAAATIVDLNLELKNYETETGTEIAVVLIDSTAGQPISSYATELGNAWGVGKSGADNGALLLIAVADRELFIATGSQLEGGLTDLEANEIIETVITPAFRAGDFDAGVRSGVAAMQFALAGESFTALRTGGDDEEFPWFGAVYFFVLFVLPWFAAILGRSKKIWPGGLIGGVGGGIGGAILAFPIFGIAAAAVALGLFGLVFDRFVSRNFANAKKSGGRVAWWAGGGRGRSRGGGFGGFGGGGFSGGGSGGRW